MKRYIFLLCIVLASCSKPITRQQICLSGEWTFALDSNNAGEAEHWFEKGIPAVAGQKVTVPHTWSNMFTDSRTAIRYWCKGWYEKKLEIPSEFKGKLLRLQFDAVYHDAVIWINGKKAGEHMGSGYTRFYIDATSLLKTGGMQNTIVVMADNSSSRQNISFLKSYDWPHDGGIIRNVYLDVTEKTSIENVMVYGQPLLDKQGNGVAHINVKIINQQGCDENNLKLKATVSEFKTKKTVWSGDLNAAVKDGSCKLSIPFNNIHWWHFDDPALYVIKVELFCGEKKMDEYATRFGFRSISATKTHFVLNGEAIRLMGLEWMPGSTLNKGMAETHDDLKKNLEMMKDLNCIYSRFHWQQDDFIYDWCDENGMLYQEEIPYWGGVTMINDTLLALGKKHLDEMIADHFNHPSIISWGIGNELRSHDSINIKSLNELYRYTKSLDSSRLVTYVSNHLGSSINDKKNKNLLRDATEIGDVMMFNEYYSTWYGQSTDVVSSELDRIHSEYPDKSLTISEWGLCEPAFKGGDARRCREMKIQKAVYDSKPYVSGAIYFCFNDYRTHMGEDFTLNYPQRVHGVADINLKPKPSYDTLKAISSPIQVIKITRADGKVTVALKGNTGLPSHIVRNYTLSAGENSVIIPDLKPGEVKTVEVKSGNSMDKIIIKRSTGFVVVEI